MNSLQKSEKQILKDFGDGLVLRRGTRDDAEALADFNGRIHSDEGPDQPNEWIRAWVGDLATLPHPTFDVSDFTIVEDTSSGKIVSSLNLIDQTWSYAGIPFKVGRPELVGTLPEYRHRGLIRAQFDVIHQWCVQRGHMVQGITGIPYYYRLFGYEMAMELGGGRSGYKPQLPKLKEGEQEPFLLRPASEEDIPFLMEVAGYSAKRYLVNCLRDHADWHYEIYGKSDKNANRRIVRIITGRDGERVGFLTHPVMVWRSKMYISLFELKPGISWGAVSPVVLRYIYGTGQEIAKKSDPEGEVVGFAVGCGTSHPIYEVMKSALPHYDKPYAWYLRVPDLIAFLKHISPVLEQRLGNSYFVAHTGELKLTFYQSGLRFVFEKGKLKVIESWRPEPHGHSGDAAFPGLTFLQLLFGYRSLDSLRDAFPDCWWDTDLAYGLLTALFPAQASDVWPLS